MQPTKEQLLAATQMEWEHNRRLAAIRLAKRENHTWSSDHSDSIRNQIKYLERLLREAEEKQ